MTTAPLPPLPAHFASSSEHLQNDVRNYATEARADMAAENQRLREALTLTFSHLVEHIDRWDEELLACKKMVKVVMEKKP